MSDPVDRVCQASALALGEAAYNLVRLLACMKCPTCPHPEHHDQRCTPADAIPVCDCPGRYYTIHAGIPITWAEAWRRVRAGLRVDQGQ